MTMITSKYHSDNILGWESGTQMPTPPTSLYLALLTAMPTDDLGTNLVEASGAGYSRIVISAATWAAIAAADGVTEQSSTNTNLSVTPTASIGTIVGVAIYDAASSGHWLRAMTLTGGSVVIGANVTLLIPSGSLTRQVA